MNSANLRYSFLSGFLLCLMLIISLTSCDRYRVTVNERPVFEPPSLFKNYRITDPALAECVSQAVIDQHVTRPEQLSLLVCSYAGVISLEGLPVFTQLTQINLKGNNLSEIKPLLFLPQLKTVNLSENPSLNCKDSQLLEEQLEGELTQPKHCWEFK